MAGSAHSQHAAAGALAPPRGSAERGPLLRRLRALRPSLVSLRLPGLSRRRPTSLRAGDGELVRTGDYLAADRQLYRVEDLTPHGALIEDCRNGDLFLIEGGAWAATR
jgi:hypothetical protein